MLRSPAAIRVSLLQPEARLSWACRCPARTADFGGVLQQLIENMPRCPTRLLQLWSTQPGLSAFESFGTGSVFQSFITSLSHGTVRKLLTAHAKWLSWLRCRCVRKASRRVLLLAGRAQTKWILLTTPVIRVSELFLIKLWNFCFLCMMSFCFQSNLLHSGHTVLGIGGTHRAWDRGFTPSWVLSFHPHLLFWVWTASHWRMSFLRLLFT